MDDMARHGKGLYIDISRQHGKTLANGQKNKSLTHDKLTPELLAQPRELNKDAADRGETLAEMALAWTLHQAGTTSVWVGANGVGQLEKT